MYLVRYACFLVAVGVLSISRGGVAGDEAAEKGKEEKEEEEVELISPLSFLRQGMLYYCTNIKGGPY